jgi:hypothetical protein
LLGLEFWSRTVLWWSRVMPNTPLLSLPITERCGSGLSIVQYIDDTLLFLKACPRKILALKSLLNTFDEST